jgi:hypothetical protein
MFSSSSSSIVAIPLHAEVTEYTTVQLVQSCALVQNPPQWMVDNGHPPTARMFCKSKAAEFSGGTIAPVVYLDCRVEQTIRRTMWLSALLERNDSFPPIAAAY